ncbi:Vp91 [Penaeus monodon nudivirus]|uniref:Vp91 n=1 Tax=Penaeus monodon nudivirus TaxID=1529056 RepID=A0A076FC40_9VIRU|nr:Vp91 [Penaeus monodon nudivirus]AII15797.1 Vp91 [Penaeus monodon nudivirus]
MSIVVYGVIALILFLLVFLYYVIQRPRSIDIEDVYGKYLISATSPDVAFTYRKRSDGKYENYYMNFSAEGGLLNLVVSDHPVTGTGEDYIPKNHGTITESDSGFSIDGVTAEFKCPDNWTWSISNKTCKLMPLCTPDDEGKIKGIDYYHYKQLQPDMTKSEVFHDRLYAVCKENETYELNTCPDNMIYNQLAIQDATTNLPCTLYDVCSDMQEYETHRTQIDSTVLGINDYYMCLNGKSVLKSCNEGQAFNGSLGGCVPVNICSGKDDGLTVPIEGDDMYYTLCSGEQPYKIYCSTGIYELDGPDNLACNIDTSERYFDFFSNDIITIPTGLYVYKNNKREVRHAREEIVNKQMDLAPTDPSLVFFTETRNATLYQPISYQLYFLSYVNNETLEDSVEIALDSNNYKEFNPKYGTSASYFNNQLSVIDWNVFEDMPIFDVEDAVYYKYDTKIKHKTDGTFNEPSINYFYFNTAKELYEPKRPKKLVKDEPSGILCYAEFELLRKEVFSFMDVDLYKALYVLRLIKMPDGVYIMYFTNPFDNELVAVAFSSKVIMEEGITITSTNKCVSKLYNYDELKVEDVSKFYVQLTSIRWDGSVLSDDQYVLPNILAMVNFSNNKVFNKEFTILSRQELKENTNLVEFSDTVESKYNSIVEHSGDVSYFNAILNSIQVNFLK